MFKMMDFSGIPVRVKEGTIWTVNYDRLTYVLTLSKIHSNLIMVVPFSQDERYNTNVSVILPNSKMPFFPKWDSIAIIPESNLITEIHNLSDRDFEYFIDIYADVLKGKFPIRKHLPNLLYENKPISERYAVRNVIVPKTGVSNNEPQYNIKDVSNEEPKIHLVEETLKKNTKVTMFEVLELDNDFIKLLPPEFIKTLKKINVNDYVERYLDPPYYTSKYIDLFTKIEIMNGTIQAIEFVDLYNRYKDLKGKRKDAIIRSIKKVGLFEAVKIFFNNKQEFADLVNITVNTVTPMAKDALLFQNATSVYFQDKIYFLYYKEKKQKKYIMKELNVSFNTVQKSLKMMNKEES